MSSPETFVHPRPVAHPIRLAIAVAVALSLLAACSRSKTPAPVETVDARAQALIDSGNQAFRAGDYRLAARRYGAAVVVRNDDPAAYYGLGMALAKLGRDEEARAAYARARDLAQRKGTNP